MRLIQPTEISGYKYFTELQKQYLTQANFQTLGDILTILPLRIDEIQPMQDDLVPGVQYQNIFTIIAVTYRKSQRG